MMDTENFVDVLQDLIDCYKLAHDPHNPVMKEIKMWRAKHAIKQGMDYMTGHEFLTIPSDTLLLDEYRKHYGIDPEETESSS